MMGVVLWSDQEDCKAVFWCEDHGDLAYYDGIEKDNEACSPLSAGDLVNFEIITQGKTRRAQNAELVEQSTFGGLSETLKSTVARNDREAARASRGARVIALNGPGQSSQRHWYRQNA